MVAVTCWICASAPHGLIEASGNRFVNSGGSMQAGDDVFTPPYAYTLRDAADVKDLVLAGAGAGILTLAGDYNRDGRVDAGDYVRWRNHLGDPDESAIGHNGDGGEVTLSDYAWWKQHYDATLSGSGGLAGFVVPEPTAAPLILAALAAMLGGGASRRIRVMPRGAMAAAAVQVAAPTIGRTALAP